MREIAGIYLCWRKGQGERRHIVGVLKRNATEGVIFRYLNDGVRQAKSEGFAPYPEFLDLNKVYSDNVIETFGQRIIKSERLDIQDFLDFWEIDKKYKDDKFYLLAHTQGLSPTDNFEFLAEYNRVRSLCFMTDLASLSVLKLKPGTVQKGDNLTFSLEPSNKQDKHAVKIFKNGYHVGYIKKIHSRVFHKKGRGKFILTVKATEQNGVLKKIFVKVETK